MECSRSISVALLLAVQPAIMQCWYSARCYGLMILGALPPCALQKMEGTSLPCPHYISAAVGWVSGLLF